MTADACDTPIGRQVWYSRYCWRDEHGAGDRDIDDTWWRVARAAASAERQPAHWAERFHALLEGFRLLPGGRILAGAGTGRALTLANCFVMGTIDDGMEGIFDALKESALTLQRGGGIGCDFSTLRPAEAPADAAGGIASGPVAFMHLWDSMCATVLASSNRRGAMMANLRCDHPDIESFIDAKSDPAQLRHFNLSVLVSDAFMAAVDRDEAWPLVFPACRLGRAGGEASVTRDWPGFSAPVSCRVLRTVSARALWRRLMHAAYDYAEPGVLFIDRINQCNPLSYAERLHATNPCGEAPLPPYGACTLGSLNLTKFVRDPFGARAHADLDALRDAAGLAVRLLDDIVDVSPYPLPAQRRQAQRTRRIGLGITGLADALYLLGLDYGSQAGRAQAAELLRTVSHAAYRSSAALAIEKGAFPACDPGRHARGDFIRALPADIVASVRSTGLRNSHLLAIAPAGTISLLAGNVSSGIEPVFSLSGRRRIRQDGGRRAWCDLDDYAWARWRSAHPTAPAPAHFRTARELAPGDHLAMQAVLQPLVDQAISKTINVAADYPFEAFLSLYRDAYRLGLKGCTAYRPNPVTGAILSTEPAPPHCCDRNATDD